MLSELCIITSCWYPNLRHCYSSLYSGYFSLFRLFIIFLFHLFLTFLMPCHVMFCHVADDFDALSCWPRDLRVLQTLPSIRWNIHGIYTALHCSALFCLSYCLSWCISFDRILMLSVLSLWMIWLLLPPLSSPFCLSPPFCFLFLILPLPFLLNPSYHFLSPVTSLYPSPHTLSPHLSSLLLTITITCLHNTDSHRAKGRYGLLSTLNGRRFHITAYGLPLQPSSRTRRGTLHFKYLHSYIKHINVYSFACDIYPTLLVDWYAMILV